MKIDFCDTPIIEMARYEFEQLSKDLQKLIKNNLMLLSIDELKMVSVTDADHKFWEEIDWIIFDYGSVEIKVIDEKKRKRKKTGKAKRTKKMKKKTRRGGAR